MQGKTVYHDIFISDVKDAKSYTRMFTLWPKEWERYLRVSRPTFTWRTYPFNNNSREKVPSNKGVYAFVVNPQIADCECSYLMYIGKTNDLKRRYGEYLLDKKKDLARPKIVLLLRQYSDKHLFFCYATLNKQVRLKSIENSLMSAFTPPCNDRIPGEVGRVMRAIR